MLPTYNESLNIVRDNKNFFMKEEIVDGNKVSIFGHRLASYSDFYDKSGNETDALELRGITYVHRHDGTIHTYPALRKFFNVNQTKGSMYEDLVDIPITRVQDKADGSMINFIYADGVFHAKSKMTFFSDQAVAANKLAQTVSMKKFLHACHLKVFGARLFPIFEYVSPWNKIVLDYPTDKLILLQLRDEEGRIVDFSADEWTDRLFDMGIETSRDFEGESHRNLEYLLWRAESATNFEGYVVTFENGKQAKVKTQWYFEMHKLITEHITAENMLIEMIVNENIDDALAQLVSLDPRRVYAESVTEAFNTWFNSNVDRLESIIKFDDTVTKRKKFALKHQGDPFFSVLMKCINSPESVTANLRITVLRSLRKLSAAKEFVENILEIKKA
jgi:T4 RnlA family RNA ligase